MEPIFKRNENSAGNWTRLGLALSLACLLNLASPAAAEVTVNTDEALKAALTDPDRADGDVIILAPGLEMDLSSGPRITVEKELTIQGQAGAVKFYDAIKNANDGLAQAIKNNGAAAALAGVEAQVDSLKATLNANLPGTVLQGGADKGGGIYFKKASSLINLTIKGFDVDVVTGATYMPHLTDTDVIANDGNGFKRFENLALIDNKIKNDKQIDGGILGTPSNDLELADHYAPEFMEGMLVMNNRIESTTNRVIGGALGAWGSYGLVEGSAFINNSIQSGTSGVASGSAMAPNHITTLKDSLFYGNSSVSSASSGRGAIYLYSSDEEHSINLMENVFFIKNTAKGNSAYGGAISDRSINGLETIKNSVFAFNEIKGDGAAYGGAIDAGSGGAGGTSGGGGIKNISGSLFYGNKALSGTGAAYGGAIIMGVRSAFANDAAWRSSNLNTTVTDSQFINNEASSDSGAAYGGAIMLETNGYTADGTPTLKTIDFVATTGGETLFSGNKANGQANAIYVGQRSGDSSFDVVFNMKPNAGGRVAFDDPITVNMNNGKSFTLGSSGQGSFYWNGINDFNADGGSYVNFESGLNILGSDFTLSSSQAKDIFVSLEKPAVINVDLAGRNKNLALFDNVAELKSDQASLGLGSYMIGDFSGSWLLATGDDLAGLYDFNLISGINDVNGLATIVGLDYSQPNAIWMNVTRTGTDQVFHSAGKNVLSAESKIKDLFNNQLSGQDRAAAFTEVMNNLAALTPEAAVSQALVGQRLVRGVSAEVRKYQDLAAGSTAPSAGYADDAGFRLWGGFFGLKQDQDDSDGFHGYDSDMRGGIFGLTRYFNPNFSGGFYLAVGDGDTEFDRLRSKTDTKLIQLGLLGAYDFGNGFSLSGDMNYAKLNNSAGRKGPGGGAYEADYDQKVFAAGLEAACAFIPWENGRLRPFLGLRYQRLEQDGFSESGGVWARQVKSVEHDSFTTSLGASLAHDLFTEGGLVITPEISAAWLHEFGDEQVTAKGQYLASPGFFNVKSLKGDEDFARVGASLNLTGCDQGGLSFKAGYEAALGSDYTEQSYYGLLNFAW